MYRKFFGLSARPFALTPDPAFLYESRLHGIALSTLQYGIESQAPILLLTGDVGSGKTTLLHRLLQDVGDTATVALVSQTYARTRSILAWVAASLDAAPRDGSDVALYEAIVDRVLASYRTGRRTLLVVDEAQNLGADVIEELRLLSNVNSATDVVLQILLVGQPELRQTLSEASMRQIAQRVAADFHLRSLDRDETGRYIAHRLAVAGCRYALFDDSAIDAVFTATRGVPRLINQLCDYALVYAFSEGRASVDAPVVREVLADREASGSLNVFGSVPPESVGFVRGV